MNADRTSKLGVTEWQGDQNTDGSLNMILAKIADLKNEVASEDLSGVTYSELLDMARIWAEGTDEEVGALGGIHSSKTWAEIFSQQQFVIRLRACTGLSIVIDTQHGTNRLMWKDPDDIKTDETSFAEWGKTELWRKQGTEPPAYPGENGCTLMATTDLSGTYAVKDAYSMQAFEDTSVVPGTTYTYKLFSYNTAGHWNNLDANEFPNTTSLTWPMIHQYAQAGTLSAICSVRRPVHDPP